MVNVSKLINCWQQKAIFVKIIFNWQSDKGWNRALQHPSPYPLCFIWKKGFYRINQDKSEHTGVWLHPKWLGPCKKWKWPKSNRASGKGLGGLKDWGCVYLNKTGSFARLKVRICHHNEVFSGHLSQPCWFQPVGVIYFFV